MQRFMKYSRRKRSSSPRRGQILLMFFFFLLAFLPLMALIVDLSLVRLARREMQTAVNAAALEGLRGQGRNDSQGQGLIHSEEKRRMNVRNLLRAVPRSSADKSFWNWPDLELNLDNMASGDMATGVYSAGLGHQEGTANSNPDYPFDREDFEYSVDENVVDAFLVRRRRTNVPETLPGVSSQGRAVLLVFGHIWAPPIPDIRENGLTVRAAAIAQARPAMMVGPAFLELAEGLEVHREPVFIRGAAPFAVEMVEWERALEPRTFVLNVTERQLCPENGQDCDNPIPVIPLRVRELRDEDRDRKLPVKVFGPVTVGLPTELLGYGKVPEDEEEEEEEEEEEWSHALTHTGTYEYYLPLYDTVPLSGPATSIQLIVGFGRVLIDPVNDPDDPSYNGTARIDVTFLDDQVVAPHNAASLARSNWQAELREFLLGRLPADEVPSELQRLVNLAWRRAAEISFPDGQSEDAPRRGRGLLAPALVRALD